MNSYVPLGGLIASISQTHRFDKDELVFLNTSDVLAGKILINHYTKVSELKGQAKKTIKNGDILYSEIRPKNKRYAYVKNIKNIEDYVVSTKLMVLRNISKDVLVNDYLYHFLTAERTLDYLQQRAENRIGSFPQITFDVVRTLQIWLPEISIQKKIASILSSLDAKIELNNLINNELEAMVKLIYEYWFVQFDFPNEQGQPYKSSGGKMVYDPELKREIPEGWEVKPLSDVTTFISRGISPKYLDKGGVCVLNQKCIRNNTVLFADARRNDNKKQNAEAKRVQLYDILVNSTGVGTLGRVAVVNRLPEDFITVDSHVTIVRSNDNIINRFYFAFSLLEKQNEIERFANGSTGQVELSRFQLEGIKVIIPPNNIQKKFESAYKSSLGKMANCHEENEQLAALRDWLLPMLMNGQVTVKDAKEKVSELGLVAEPEVKYKNQSY